MATSYGELFRDEKGQTENKFLESYNRVCGNKSMSIGNMSAAWMILRK